eukprot:8404188-Alexandrium_andersonii.AAC.1
MRSWSSCKAEDSRRAVASGRSASARQARKHAGARGAMAARFTESEYSPEGRRVAEGAAA